MPIGSPGLFATRYAAARTVLKSVADYAPAFAGRPLMSNLEIVFRRDSVILTTISFDKMAEAGFGQAAQHAPMA